MAEPVALHIPGTLFSTIKSPVEDGIHIPRDFSYTIIPWEKVKRLEKVIINTKEFEIGITTSDPFVKLNKFQRMFPPAYVSETAIALSPFMDKNNSLLKQVESYIELYQTQK